MSNCCVFDNLKYTYVMSDVFLSSSIAAKYKDTGIQGSLFTSDIKMCIGIGLGDVPFTR